MQYITGQVTLINVDHPEQPPVVLRIPGGKIDLSSNFKEGAPQLCCAHGFGRLIGGCRQVQNEDRSRGPGFGHCRAVCFVIHLFRLGVFSFFPRSSINRVPQRRCLWTSRRSGPRPYPESHHGEVRLVIDVHIFRGETDACRLAGEAKCAHCVLQTSIYVL
jgi:hypothetical protein